MNKEDLRKEIRKIFNESKSISLSEFDSRAPYDEPSVKYMVFDVEYNEEDAELIFGLRWKVSGGLKSNRPDEEELPRTKSIWIGDEIVIKKMEEKIPSLKMGDIDWSIKEVFYDSPSNKLSLKISLYDPKNKTSYEEDIVFDHEDIDQILDLEY